MKETPRTWFIPCCLPRDTLPVICNWTHLWCALHTYAYFNHHTETCSWDKVFIQGEDHLLWLHWKEKKKKREKTEEIVSHMRSCYSNASKGSEQQRGAGFQDINGVGVWHSRCDVSWVGPQSVTVPGFMCVLCSHLPTEATQQVRTKVIGCLPPTWETQTEFGEWARE